MRSQDGDQVRRSRATGSSRTTGDPGRGRRPARYVLGRVETLESRMLLTAGPSLPAPAPLFVLSTPSTALVALQAPSSADLVKHPIGSIVPVDQATTPGPSLLLDAAGHSTDLGHFAMTSAPLLSITSLASEGLGEGMVRPFFVVSNPLGFWSSWSTGRFDAGPMSAAGVSGATVAGGWGIGWGVLTASQGLATTPSDLTVTVPFDNQVNLQTSLGGVQSSLLVQIPVDPSTHELALSIRSRTVSGPLPVVDQLSLVDETGSTLERFGPLWNPQPNPSGESMTVSLDAPVSGKLLLQLSAPPDASGGTNSSLMGASPAGAASFPFTIDVQRQELSPAATGVAGSPLMVEHAGLLGVVVGAVPQSGSPPGAPGIGGHATAVVENSVQVPGGPMSLSAEIPVEQVPDGEASRWDPASPPEFTGRIAAGPLAARNAAPLGPSLATVIGDAAPEVDRHERALSQEILGAEERSDPRGRRPVAERRGPGLGPADTGEFEGSWSESAGLGPMPMKDSPAAGGRGVDLEALLAALPGLADRGERPDDAREGWAFDPRLAALAAPRPPDGGRRAESDYFRSACALAVGMGLITGPIIPDLLRLIPRRPSRWRLAPGAAGPRAVDPGSRARRCGW